MTEVFLDGIRIDVEPGQVRQTLQNNTLGTVKDRQLSYTNVFTAYDTARNAQFFGVLEELNNTSDKPYRYMIGKIVEDGVELATGSATIRKTRPGEVEIYIYFGNNGIYQSIANKSIRDLDWSDLNHVATSDIVVDSFLNTSQYIYAMVNQTNVLNKVSELESWLPSVFEHYIFDKIFTEAGFEYSGLIFDTPDFKAPVINPVTFDEEEENPYNRDFSKFMPDISQTDFIKDILIRYGLMFDKARNEDRYIFKQFKEIFANTQNPADWSAKYIKDNDTEYNFGKYGQKNYFRYANFEGYNGGADGNFAIDVENLPESETLATSVYEARPVLPNRLYLETPIFEYDEENNVSITTTGPTISKLDRRASLLVTIKKNGVTDRSYTGPIAFLTFEGMAFQKFVTDNYIEFQQIVNRPKVVDYDVFLDPIDIYLIDFFRLVWIKSKSSYFYLNKVSNFVSGKDTAVQLVRIPPNVFSGATATASSAPVVNLFADKMTLLQRENVKFTHNITDADNDVASWKLNFSTGSGNLPQSGLGYPPNSITLPFNNAGTFTARLEVKDFQGNVGFDTVAISVGAIQVTNFEVNTGFYTAQPGSVVTVTAEFRAIFGHGHANVWAGTGNVGSGSPLFSNLMSLLVTYPEGSSEYSVKGSKTFIMPEPGRIWIKAQHVALADAVDEEDPGGPGRPVGADIPKSFTSITIKNNTDTITTTLSSTGSATKIPR